jgi:hypothetical protein
MAPDLSNPVDIPLVLVPQHFGSVVYDRRTCQYLPFDQEATSVFRSHSVSPLAELLNASGMGFLPSVVAFGSGRVTGTTPTTTRVAPRHGPTGPAEGEERVLRGGSWTDCAEAVTVSFRYSRRAISWREGGWAAHYCPNIGFRICCVRNA